MKKIIYLLISLVILSCNKEDDQSDNLLPEDNKNVYTFDFNSIGKENWKGFFSDYFKGKEDFFELACKITSLPQPLNTNVKSLMLAGSNKSDDLLSVVYREFDGLEPNKKYAVTFDIYLASDVLIGGVGIGGDPNLTLGAGGINYEPKNGKDKNESNLYRPNFKSKLQTRSSNDVFKSLGEIGVTQEYPTKYKLVNRNNLDDPIELTTNSKGKLWIMIGLDSGYEGKTTLYFKSIKISLK